MITIRATSERDFDTIVHFIHQLARYEHLEDGLRFEPDRLRGHLFGPAPAAEVLLAEDDAGAAVGFALFFQTFSTFAGRPNLFLEDLFVEPTARGQGVARLLFRHLALIARDRGCARIDWSVLDWNELAKGFYRSIGAWPVTSWEPWSISGDVMAKLAGD